MRVAKKRKVKNLPVYLQNALKHLMVLGAILYLLIPLAPHAKAEAGRPVWTPTGAQPEGFDWIQLTNGEWLKGDLKVLYNEALEFDSDELDLQTFDWEDVQQVICHEPQSIRLEDPEAKGYNLLNITGQGQTVVGMLRIQGDKVIMETEEGTKEFDRSKLVSIAPGEARELDFWAINLTLSVDISAGNTEKEDYSANLNLRRRTSLTRFYFDYLGIYTETFDVETSNSHRANTYFDIFSTRRFYWRPVFAEYYRDLFANIAHRGTIGAGVGYTIIDTARTEWIVTPGVAYIYTEYDSVESGEDQSVSTPALVVSTEFDTELTKKTDFNVLYQFNVVNEESGTYTHHSKASLEFELTGTIDLDLSIVWDRIQEPAADSDGNVPKQDDLYFFFGFTFEL
jgi:putative salt-induced outer membrane protein YdiY